MRRRTANGRPDKMSERKDETPAPVPAPPSPPRGVKRERDDDDAAAVKHEMRDDDEADAEDDGKHATSATQDRRPSKRARTDAAVARVWARFLEGTRWRDVMHAVQNVCTETNIHWSSEGVLVEAMDPAHVSLVQSFLSGTDGVFQEYKPPVHDFVTGVHTALLFKVLRLLNTPKTTVGIEASADVDDLRIVFERPGMLDQVRLKLLDIEQESMAAPDIDYVVRARLLTSDWRSYCTGMHKLGAETLELAAVPGELTLDCNLEGGSGKRKVRSDTDSGVDIACSARRFPESDGDGRPPSPFRVALKLVAMFLGDAAPLADHVTVFLAPDTPMMMEFALTPPPTTPGYVPGQSSARDYSYVRYYLAPKLAD